MAYTWQYFLFLQLLSNCQKEKEELARKLL